MEQNIWTCPNCGSVKSQNGFCTQCGKINDTDIIDTGFVDASCKKIAETNELGEKVISAIDNNGNTRCITTFHNNSISEIVYDENGSVLFNLKFYSAYDSSTTYFENGKTSATVENSKDGSIYTLLDKNGKISSKSVYDAKGNGVEEKYNSSGKLASIIKTDQYDNVVEETFVTYEDNTRKESVVKNDKLISEKVFFRDTIDYTVDYEYQNDKVIKKTINHMKGDYNGKLTNIHTYSYINYEVKVKNVFYVDGKKIIEFNNDDISVSYTTVNKNKGQYTFYNKDNNVSCTVDMSGNIRYLDAVKGKALYLNNDGTFTSNGKVKGSFHYDEDGNIICVADDGSIFEYNDIGSLIKEINGNEITEYNYAENKEIKTVNGDSVYRRINHIEYEEDDYYTLMTNLTSIGNNIYQNIASECNAVSAICSNISPEAIPCDTSGVLSAASVYQETLNNLKTTINYSLLAYDTCDKDLKDSVDKYIINNLFDSNETNIEKYFKNNINSYIEDRNGDGIFEYKKDTDFNELYEKVIPKKTYRDILGNLLYFNSNNDLIGMEGNVGRIIHGGNTFTLELTDNGAVKLTELDGKPLNIFGDYNNASSQFGGSQSDLDNVTLLEDRNILNILDRYYPMSSFEEKEQFLKRASEKGCGYTAITNAIFKEMEGHEDKFLDTFGFPMYNVKIDNKNNLVVDYNYEPVILELFSEFNGKNEIIGYGIAKAEGTYDEKYNGLRDFVNDKYKIKLGNDNSPNPLFDSYGIFSDSYYKIYTMNGKLTFDANSKVNGGAHAMTKIGETKDGKWIISTWGNKAICETNEPIKIR